MENYAQIKRKIEEAQELIIEQMSKHSDTLYEKERDGNFYSFRNCYNALDRLLMAKKWVIAAEKDEGLPF